MAGQSQKHQKATSQTQDQSATMSGVIMQIECADCGIFVAKELRVPVRKWPDQKPLCYSCRMLNDSSEFM